MKPQRIKTQALLITAAATLTAHSAVFTDDFMSSSLNDDANGFIGGNFGDQWEFGEWYGSSQDAEISAGNLTVGSDAGYRSGVIIFDQGTFTDGAGEYTLTVDVSAIDIDITEADLGQLRVWSGAGFDLTNSSGDAIFVNPQTGEFEERGNATVSDLGSLSFTETGTHEFQFTYDGSSAIGIFLGVQNDAASPFPEVSYDRMELAAIPETSTSLLGGLGVMMLLTRRRRHRFSGK